MSHLGNDAVIEQIRDEVAEMSHKEKVLTLLEYFYEAGLTIEVTVGHEIAFNRKYADAGGYHIGGVTVPYGDMSGLDAKVAQALFDRLPDGGDE